jgi:hypothetical protein
MRAKDFIKEDHGFLAPGSHDWEGKVGKNIWNYLKNLPSGAWDGFKNVVGLDDGDEDEPSVLSKPEVVKEPHKQPSHRNSGRKSRTGRTSRTGRQERTSRIGGD